ncbi:F-box/LRR-repeat protein 6 [Rhinoderma darwinii]|uniref:F-box/LRR-repeat protein 6 n=1 Tax=Rhinoderma darwinii TaxID=43563 RepID=UPI003F6614E2
MASRSSRGSRAGKRVKKTRRPQGEDYYIQHTDKDMLLLIPRELEETVTVVKRVRRLESDHPPITEDCGWGSVMPPEIIHSIFQLAVDSEGAVPALCRLAQVCRLWNHVASSPDLWKRVAVSHCWSRPGHRIVPKLQNKMKDTIETLIQKR